MKVQTTLRSDKPVILADTREASSKVPGYLEEMEAIVTQKQIDVADYIASSRVAIERKTIDDFLQSILDGRIFQQAHNLSSSYTNGLLIIEGNPELLYTSRDINSNAIRGAIASIAIDLRVPLIWARNQKETASMIYSIARREQFDNGHEVRIRSGKKPESMGFMQEYIVAGLPSISTKLSKRLLSHFRSPKAVFNSSMEELMAIEKIGKEKARKIWEAINSEYQQEK